MKSTREVLGQFGYRASVADDIDAEVQRRMGKPTQLSKEQIEAWRAGSADFGDSEFVALCDLALQAEAMREALEPFEGIVRNEIRDDEKDATKIPVRIGFVRKAAEAFRARAALNSGDAG